MDSTATCKFSRSVLSCYFVVLAGLGEQRWRKVGRWKRIGKGAAARSSSDEAEPSRHGPEQRTER